MRTQGRAATAPPSRLGVAEAVGCAAAAASGRERVEPPARAVEGGADLRSRVTSPTLSPVNESTGRVAASARSARRTETAAFVLKAACGATAAEGGGRKEVAEEERKEDEDEESESRRGEATPAPGIVPALLR